jgi:hypothetical protein
LVHPWFFDLKVVNPGAAETQYFTRSTVAARY